MISWITQLAEISRKLKNKYPFSSESKIENWNVPKFKENLELSKKNLLWILHLKIAHNWWHIMLKIVHNWWYFMFEFVHNLLYFMFEFRNNSYYLPFVTKADDWVVKVTEDELVLCSIYFTICYHSLFLSLVFLLLKLYLYMPSSERACGAFSVK